MIDFLTEGSPEAFVIIFLFAIIVLFTILYLIFNAITISESYGPIMWLKQKYYSRKIKEFRKIMILNKKPVTTRYIKSIWELFAKYDWAKCACILENNFLAESIIKKYYYEVVTGNEAEFCKCMNEKTFMGNELSAGDDSFTYLSWFSEDCKTYYSKEQLMKDRDVLKKFANTYMLLPAKMQKQYEEEHDNIITFYNSLDDKINNYDAVVKEYKKYCSSQTKK